MGKSPIFYLSPSPSLIRKAKQLSAQMTKLAQFGEIFILRSVFVVMFLLDLKLYSPQCSAVIGFDLFHTEKRASKKKSATVSLFTETEINYHLIERQ